MMGRLDLANDRRTSIPWKINDDDGEMKTVKNTYYISGKQYMNSCLIKNKINCFLIIINI